MYKSILLALIISPICSYCQLFDDIKKEEDRTNYVNKSKGFFVGVSYSPKVISGITHLEYVESYYNPSYPQTPPKNTSTHSGSGNKRNVLYDLDIGYRYKYFAGGIGLNKMALSSSFGYGPYNKYSVDENIDITNLSLNLKGIYFTESMGLELRLQYCLPVALKSELTESISSSKNMAVSLNFLLRIYKQLYACGGLTFRSIDLKYNTFDYPVQTGDGYLAGTSVEYDFSKNAGRKETMSVFDLHVGLQYHFNKLIK